VVDEAAHVRWQSTPVPSQSRALWNGTDIRLWREPIRVIHDGTNTAVERCMMAVLFIGLGFVALELFATNAVRIGR
jgi:hypothetical protein